MSDALVFCSVDYNDVEHHSLLRAAPAAILESFWLITKRKQHSSEYVGRGCIPCNAIELHCSFRAPFFQIHGELLAIVVTIVSPGHPTYIYLPIYFGNVSSKFTSGSDVTLCGTTPDQRRVVFSIIHKQR